MKSFLKIAFVLSALLSSYVLGFWSLGIPVHWYITSAFVADDFVDVESYTLLQLANSDTDLIRAKYSDHALHFDSEAFEAGTHRLAENLNLSIDALSDCNKPLALERLGEAFHSAQDFYSHSNWIENHLAPGVVPGAIPISTALVRAGGTVTVTCATASSSGRLPWVNPPHRSGFQNPALNRVHLC